MKNKFLIIFSLIFIYTLSTTTFASSDSSVETYFESVKNNPAKLAKFLKKMPKGGDLHNHLGGASMAENLINYAKNDELCVDKHSYTVIKNTSCPRTNLFSNAIHDRKFYHNVIDAWSMRHFQGKTESGHDHFFATFGKYSPVSAKHTGEILSEVVNRAGKQNELYMELMVTPDNNASGKLGATIGWDENLSRFRDKLLNNGLKPIVKNISTQLNASETVLNNSLHCGTERAKPGCRVKVRYLYQVLREQPPAQIFAQLLAGFEAASSDSRVVGINIVQPEDGKIALSDYDLHMRMIEFLHAAYPNVHISLHAGELVPGLVTATDLHSHIRHAVEVAHATRIGHGVDIAFEDNSNQLLLEMARQHVMVEINLSSNAAILGVTGNNHPLPLYLHYGVPVALSTDDEGVIRTNLTEQYKQALLSYPLSYANLKNLVRNSITYSFLPGASLWSDYGYQTIVPACKTIALGSDATTATCQTFLDSNEKASMQWKLEKQFTEFEKSLT